MTEGMIAPPARPRRKNDGTTVPPQQACPLRGAEGALSFLGIRLALKPSTWRRLFPKKKAPHLRAGLVLVGG